MKKIIEQPDVQFILTGGTIDSYYDATKDTAVPNRHSVIPEYIKSLKINNKVIFTQVCMKDSRSLTQNDRKKILETIEKSVSKKIIITHGTYTMPDTAKYLQANLKRKNKVIILTGSMIPIQGFSPSDAGFNLGFALGQLNYLPDGIYVCMNGTIFNPQEVVKIINEGKFTSVFSRS